MMLISCSIKERYDLEIPLCLFLLLCLLGQIASASCSPARVTAMGVCEHTNQAKLATLMNIPSACMISEGHKCSDWHVLRSCTRLMVIITLIRSKKTLVNALRTTKSHSYSAGSWLNYTNYTINFTLTCVVLVLQNGGTG
ncbi:hypothetical protein PVAP13_9NG715028 [Panicum virgatum]|uniref:Uncharacterized protein n=1 Tax=Panicum virgatum TaxID=38727 RepID=A0A8T0N0Q8_PANVG|nr:hypothetical protein PVAP13_9NG715028 [Panicum virgatum]